MTPFPLTLAGHRPISASRSAASVHLLSSQNSSQKYLALFSSLLSAIYCSFPFMEPWFNFTLGFFLLFCSNVLIWALCALKISCQDIKITPQNGKLVTSEHVSKQFNDMQTSEMVLNCWA